jgi:hypothetical protein
MARIQGSFGRVEAFNDFTGGGPSGPAGTSVPGTVNEMMGGGVGFFCVNEGSFLATVDEPNGVLKVTTDTADNDNAALWAGAWSPSEGPLVFEARFKSADITLNAIYAGFTQTLDATTPVVPAEYATTTVTYNGTGSMSGMLWDPDGTANDWRSIFGDAGVIAGGTVGGALANTGEAKDAVNDVYDIVRCEVDSSGTARNYLNGVLVAELVGAYATTADNLHAVLIVENRSAAASVIEVDYFYASGYRDWSDGS